MIYGTDSLFTLAPVEIAGVIALSAVLWAGTLLFFRSLRRRSPRHLYLVTSLAMATVFFWMFVWLSPQAYYTYYLTIIDGLPWQVVVKWPPPSAFDLFALVTFTGDPSLSAHGQGVLGWSLFALALLRKGPRPPEA